MLVYCLVVFALKGSLALNMLVLFKRKKLLNVTLMPQLSTFEDLLSFPKAAIISEAFFDQNSSAGHIACGLIHLG